MQATRLGKVGLGVFNHKDCAEGAADLFETLHIAEMRIESGKLSPNGEGQHRNGRSVMGVEGGCPWRKEDVLSLEWKVAAWEGVDSPFRLKKENFEEALAERDDGAKGGVKVGSAPVV
jgi:hypothetical protein